LILTFNRDSILDNDLELISHQWFDKKEYCSDLEHIIKYYFNISEEMQKKVVKPFLESKYSKIDKKYINQNYNE
jgi:hypothetical protein